MNPVEIGLLVWLVGTLPATYLAARRYPAWEADGYNEGPLAMIAIIWWPAWLAVNILKPLFWIIKGLYAFIWSRGERDALTPASTQPDKPAK